VARLAGIVLCTLLVAPAAASGQQPFIYYVYDDLNRVTAVIDQQGNAATYTYDAVGNILKIERFESIGLPGAVGITLVTPTRGKVGTAVQIFGKGFGATPNENSSAFNGTRSVVSISSPNRILTSVPEGTITGPITVTSPLGSATSPTSFRVPGAISVSPTSVTVFTRRAQRFTAAEVGNSPATVSWSVNGIAGGTEDLGTISTEGLYSAPVAVPLPPTVVITATNLEDDRLSASASVRIEAAPDIFVVATPVTLQFAASTPNRTVAAAVSAQMTSAFGFIASPMSSVSVGTTITRVVPATAAPGASLTLTVSGARFDGAHTLTFVRNNAADASLVTTELTVSPDGNQLTATVTIGAEAPVGPRVVQIGTPDGTSTAVGIGGNVFTVQ
jgi:YD repeat-containing protein